LSLSIAGALVLARCAAAQTPPPGLKDVFKADFPIGVAVNQNQFSERDSRGWVKKRHPNAGKPPLLTALLLRGIYGRRFGHTDILEVKSARRASSRSRGFLLPCAGLCGNHGA
jgi:hypothetical protein